MSDLLVVVGGVLVIGLSVSFFLGGEHQRRLCARQGHDVVSMAQYEADRRHAYAVDPEYGRLFDKALGEVTGRPIEPYPLSELTPRRRPRGKA